MTLHSQDKNKQNNIATNLEKNTSQSNDAPMDEKRAARFSDTQKEAFANLIPLEERTKTQ